jgi:hypothetical protein
MDFVGIAGKWQEFNRKCYDVIFNSAIVQKKLHSTVHALNIMLFRYRHINRELHHHDGPFDKEL